MTDKKFLIQDLLSPDDCSLIIPPFPMWTRTVFQTTLPSFSMFHNPNCTCRLCGVNHAGYTEKLWMCMQLGWLLIHLTQIWAAHATGLFLMIGRNRTGVSLTSSGQWETASLNVKSWSVVATYITLRSESYYVSQWNCEFVQDLERCIPFISSLWCYQTLLKSVA